MIELASLPPSAQAAILVGVVLVEAVVLYVGYGVLERIVAPPLMKSIANS